MRSLFKDVARAGVVALGLAYFGSYAADVIPEVVVHGLAQFDAGRSWMTDAGCLTGKPWPPERWWFRAILVGAHVAALAAVAYYVQSYGRKLFLPTSRQPYGHSPRRTPVLIVFLSEDTSKPPAHFLLGFPEGEPARGTGAAFDSADHGAIGVTQALAYLAEGKFRAEQAIRAWEAARAAAEAAGQPAPSGEKPSRPRWAGEQPLRAIWHHLKEGGPLRRVIVCGSSRTLSDAQSFYKLLQDRFPTVVEPVAFQALALRGDAPPVLHDLKLLGALPSPAELQSQGLDFFDHNQLVDKLGWLLDQLETEGVAPTDITLDFTSGPKPTSIAAASVSFNRLVQAQYVATNPDGGTDAPSPWAYTVYGYDFHFSVRDLQ